MRRLIAAFGLVISACYSSGEGISPPLDRVYFPVGLTTDCDRRYEPGCTPKYLYVISSDFDLQYNAGSVQGIRLDGVRFVVNALGDAPAKHCDDLAGSKLKLGLQSEADRMTYPGPCKPVDLDKNPDSLGKLLPSDEHKVGIGAFATDVLLKYGPISANHPEPRKRLLIPVRGESSLHWIDLGENGELKCNQSGSPKKCGRKHRIGTEETENLREVTMPPEPYAIAASDAGDAIVVTHQTHGALSLFSQDLDDYEGRDGWSLGPKLSFVHYLPATGAVALAAAPESEYVRNLRNQWLAGEASSMRRTLTHLDLWSRTATLLESIWSGYFAMSGLSLSSHTCRICRRCRPPVCAQTQRTPTRAGWRMTIVLDVTKKPNVGPSPMLPSTTDASNTPLALPLVRTSRAEAHRAFSVGTAEPTLTEAETALGRAFSDTPNKDMPRFDGVFPLPQGASRVYVGQVINERGEPETRLFVVCYDQRQIAVYDPKRRIIETYIRTGRGPHAMAFDFDEANPASPEEPGYALGYVGHFLDSYVGVIQLDRRKIRSYGTIVLSLAQPVTGHRSENESLLSWNGRMGPCGCQQNATSTQLRSLSGSGRVSLVCRDATSGEGRDVRACPSYQDSAVDVEDRHMLALLTQTLRGEVAVVDLTDEKVLDEDPWVPGTEFLTVGADPRAIVSTPGGIASFVAIGAAGREAIFALPTTCITAPNDGERARDLTLWAACRLPGRPGEKTIVTDPTPGGIGYRPICPSLESTTDEAIQAWIPRHRRTMPTVTIRVPQTLHLRKGSRPRVDASSW